MNKFIWDGEMDCGWEDLSKLSVDTCHKFTNTMLETVKFSPNMESRELLHSECMERLESITGVLADIIKDGSNYEYEDLDNKAQNALKLNSWILLGSLTETVLQMFPFILVITKTKNGNNGKNSRQIKFKNLF